MAKNIKLSLTTTTLLKKICLTTSVHVYFLSMLAEH